MKPFAPYFNLKRVLCFFTIISFQPLNAAPSFVAATPSFKNDLNTNSQALCATARNTLAYLKKGYAYDPSVIHEGRVAPIPLEKIKATLVFICQHQNQMNDPKFIQQHFTFIRWYPDKTQANTLSAHKPLVQHLPADRILMTRYYVHLANASAIKQPTKPYALYGLPNDERHLTLEEANTHPNLTRFKYGKQAILKGALSTKVPTLAYLNRADLEAALLQGTVIVDFQQEHKRSIFNVHRCNNIAYDRLKTPYEQERYWYFKEVDGIKGYGKDAEHKITIMPEVTFAADLQQLGLGRVILIQYPNSSGQLRSQIGIAADTGGAFANNLYQIDYLAGSFPDQKTLLRATRHIPDYVAAYFMVLRS